MDSLTNMDYSMIDEQLMTVHDRDSLLIQLEELSMSIYTTKESKVDSLTSSLQHAIVLFLQKNKVDTSNTTSVRNAFTELSTYLRGFPTLTIELAFDPTVAQLKKIAGKIELYGKRPLLQTKHNENILAGAILERSGARKDYSITVQI